MASARSSVEPMKDHSGAADNVEVIMVGSSPIGKRKAEDDPVKAKTIAEGKENNAPEKKVRTDDGAAVPVSAPTPTVELQGKRLVYRPMPMPEDAKGSNRDELLLRSEFCKVLAQASTASEKIEVIPEQFYPLAVSSGHESTTPTEAGLVKHILLNMDISADKIDESTISVNAVKALVPTLFEQKNYGFRPTDFASSSSSTQRVPAALQLRYWEANDQALEKAFPSPVLAFLRRRRAERESVRDQVVKMLSEMDDVEKAELLRSDKPGKADKQPESAKKKDRKPRSDQTAVDTENPNEVEVAPPNPSEADIGETDKREGNETLAANAMPQSSPAHRSTREGTAGTMDSRRSPSPSRKPKLTPEEEEAIRVKKEEKEARRVAREAEKAAKEQAVAKREAAKAKQQAAMNRFFNVKPAASPKPASKGASASDAAANRQDEAPRSSGPSDFQRYFKPVQRRANVDWAPINRWPKAAESSSAISDAMESGPSSPRTTIDRHLSSHGQRRVTKRRGLPLGLKSAPLYGTIKDAWDAYQEAEDPRQVLEQLRDPARFPWKVLAFDQQIRPPYSGTFTKKSVVVGARTPFKQDPQLDYSYDSGDDWEEEDENADEIDEPEADADPEDLDSDEEDGEFDDWLDDTEEGAGLPTDAMDLDDDPLLRDEAGPNEQPRSVPAKPAKKRDVPRKVVKLSPWWKGPEWEDRVGAGTEGMEPYRLQLLNNAPDSIDPFTYTSDEPAQSFKTTYSTMTFGLDKAVRCLLASDLQQVKQQQQQQQPPPEEAAKPSTEAVVSHGLNAAGPAALDTSAQGVNTLKARAAGPKVGFPDAQLADLLKSIEGSTKIRTDLVSILREQFEKVASKGAIEAKLKEVAVREGKSKDSAWRVKPEFWLAVGLPVPVTVPAATATLPDAVASPRSDIADGPAKTQMVQAEPKQSPLKAWMKRSENVSMVVDE